MKASLLSILLFWCCCSVVAQPFRIPSFYQPDYIYRITSEEARYLLDHDLQSKDTTFFHDFAGIVGSIEDTFGLPYGHYIVVNSIREARLTYTYLPLTPWRIYMPENGTDFLVQLIGIANDVPISTALVKINNKPVPFDPETSCYKISKGNQKGMLTVQYQGETFYYTVNRDRNSAFLHRLWRAPRQYLIQPAIFAVSLPFDGYKSIKEKKAQGSIFKVKQVTIAAIKSLRRKEQLHQYSGKWEERSKYRGHVFFSKPKYREGDTVKFKAHILNKKTSQWIDETLWAYLKDDSDKEHCLGQVKPEQKGDGYSFRFVLSDSMNIALDRRYSILLKNKDSFIVANEFLYYEDYELKKTVFDIELLSKDKKHFRGKPFTLKLSAKDENGLPVHDARAEFTIELKSVSGIKPDLLFLPDTLWQYTIGVTNGEMIVAIPDSIFPAANIDYKLTVIMRNSENELTLKSHYVDFLDNDQQINIALLDDSVTFETTPYSENIKAHIYALDPFDLKVLDTSVTLPYTAPINTHAKKYSCETNDMDDDLDMERMPAEISVYNYRTRDSLFFDLINPRKLTVVYHLYCNDREIRRGTGKTLALRMPAAEKDKYNMMLEYIWAGKVEAVTCNIGVPRSIVNLEVQQPPVIYPGRETEISIRATDYRNNPVSGMSILAYAFTEKFNYREPYLPYIGSDFPNKKYRNKFSLEELEPDSKSIQLNFPYWNKIKQLDTNWYYRFLFPQNHAVTPFSAAQSDSITQFAPFIVDSGMIEPVHYILIDSIPVFFGFTDTKVPYSFKIDTLPHQVKVRTSKRLVTINNLKAKAYHKTIFSISPAIKDKNITVNALPDTFTKAERHFLSFFVMGLSAENDFLSNAYMTDGSSDVVFSLTGYKRDIRAGFSTIGPVVWKYWKLNILKNFSLQFEYEPFYHYSFGRERVKMKSMEKAALFPRKLPGYIPSLNEEVITESIFQRNYKAQLDKKRHEEALPGYNDTLPGKARLKIEIGPMLSLKAPLNVILFRKDDFKFIKIYSGKTNEFNKLPEGNYELLFATPGNLYLKTGIIEVQNGGQNFYRVCWLDTFRGKDVNDIDTLLSSMYEGSYGYEITRIMNAYIKATYRGPLHKVTGTVLDEKGEPMPGVSVIIDNTTMGTYTDLEGRFTLDIPVKIAKPLLWFKTMGMKDTLMEAHPEMTVQMNVSDQLQSLSDITIYGSMIDKRSYTGAMSTVVSRNTYTRPVIDIVKAIEGKAVGVQVSSSESGSKQILFGIPNPEGAANNALVVIDGSVYSGGMASLDPAIVESLVFLKDATATSLYGARGTQGVVLITTKKGARLPEYIRKGLEPPAMPEALMLSSLRNNFRDDAYWQPDLKTDKNGKATFKVKFPDDITAWKTFVLATDARKHTGQASGLIKSYKPVSTSLMMPAFLVQGDTAQLLGKSVNYIPDTLPVTTTYYKDGTLLNEQKIRLGKYHNDTLQLVAGNTDSIRLKYLLTKEDGYFDGEEKPIPVLPKGISVAKGAFLPLDMRDTVFIIPPTGNVDTLYLSATASLLDIVDDEIRMVKEYEHLCNEQLASKIITVLNQQRIAELWQRPFDKQDKKLVQEMIDKLQQRQNTERLWGWWENGETVYWISNHVIHALLEAMKMKYNTGKLNFETILQPQLYRWQSDTAYTDIQSLKLIYSAGLKVNYESLITKMERKKGLSLSQQLDLILMRQQLQLPYQTAKLLSAQQQDVLGNIYWKDSASTIYENEILTTLTALKIIQNDSSIPVNKDKVINWLLQQRSVKGWRNIYESAHIIEAIAKDLSLGKTKAMQPQLVFSGGYQQTITQFPYRKRLTTQEPVTVSKRGAYPVYFTWHYKYWDTTNKNLGGNFALHSYFEEQERTTSVLHAGIPVIMKVKVTVDKSAEFVMIEIPIPAGCSYNNKDQLYTGYETHREYRKDKVSIFCERLPKGIYTYSIELLPRYTGTYTLNPSKAELMYFPTFYGRSILKTIPIR